MPVVKNGREIATGITQRGVEVRAEKPFENPPPVVAASHDGRIDLFTRALADIAEPLLPRDAIEAETPRVPETGGEDPVAPGSADERVVGWNRIGKPPARLIDVDTQQLSEQRLDVLGVVRRIVAGFRRRRSRYRESRPARMPACPRCGSRTPGGE